MATAPDPEMIQLQGILSRSFTAEVQATIDRIDQLIGPAHWLSVGTYKEGVIRRQLADYLPSRFSLGTGFVMGPGFEGETLRSKQLDILIWDSQNYSPIFRDGAFVVIPPQALRVAIEVKGNLTAAMLAEGLENLDSLTQFIGPLQYFHGGDYKARDGFLRFVVGGGSEKLTPAAVLGGLHRYYLRCVFDHDNPSGNLVQLPMDERLRMTRGSDDRIGLTPWITGVAVLGKGTVRCVRFFDQVAYVVANDVGEDEEDHTVGLIRAMVDRFFTTDVIHRINRDSKVTFKELCGPIMPLPFEGKLPPLPPVVNPGDAKLYTPAAPHTWELTDELAAKAKRDAKKSMKPKDADSGFDEDDL